MTNPIIEHNLSDLWVYLSSTPLLGLTITLVAYQVGKYIYERQHFNPVFNPVLIAIILLGSLLTTFDIPYQTYFDGAKFVHFLLGPATVALAIPLYQQVPQLKRLWLPLCLSLLLGSSVAVISAVGVAWLFDASQQTLLSIAPKSVTAAIAMGVSEKIGGLPSLTAILVVITGVLGAIIAKFILDFFNITNHIVRGFSVGLAAHGIGTARAFQVSAEAGAFSGLAMGLNGLLTAILFPLILSFL